MILYTSYLCLLLSLSLLISLSHCSLVAPGLPMSQPLSPSSSPSPSLSLSLPVFPSVSHILQSLPLQPRFFLSCVPLLSLSCFNAICILFLHASLPYFLALLLSHFCFCGGGPFTLLPSLFPISLTHSLSLSLPLSLSVSLSLCLSVSLSLCLSVSLSLSLSLCLSVSLSSLSLSHSHSVTPSHHPPSPPMISLVGSKFCFSQGKC